MCKMSTTQHAADVNYDACIRMRPDNGSLLFISEKTDGVPFSTSNNLFFSVHFTAARITTATFYSCLSKHLYSATSATVVQSRQRDPCSFMVALCNRADHIYFHVVSSFFFFFISSPNLSGRRLDVCHTSTHGVALVRI